ADCVAGAVAGPLALARRTSREPLGRVAQPGTAAALVHLACLAAGVVDRLALAASAGKPAALPSFGLAAMVPAGFDRRHDRAGARRPRADAGDAGTRDTGRFRPANTQAQCHGADRVVHPALLYRLGHHHLGDLDLAANRLSQTTRCQY